MSYEQAELTITSGSGGVEANAWAEMVLRMYLRWIAKRGFVVDPGRVIDRADGGVKSARFVVDGDGCGRLLRCEHGIHRLVRQSPFDKEQRRHTSFVSVSVTEMVERHQIEPQFWHRAWN